jgi:hypothetical protein
VTFAVPFLLSSYVKGWVFEGFDGDLGKHVFKNDGKKANPYNDNHQKIYVKRARITNSRARQIASAKN